MAYPFLCMLFIICLNLVDKGASILAAFFIWWLVPENIRYMLWNNGWRQTPLTTGEVRAIRQSAAGGRHSLRLRMALLFPSSALALTLILGWVSTQMHYNAAKEEGRETVRSVTQFAARDLRPEALKRFLKDGKPVQSYADPDYQKYNDMLLSLKASFPDLEYIYVYHIRKDACYTVFDTDETFQKDGVVGDRVEFDESYLSLVPDLIAGRHIEIQEAESRFGAMMTAYEPLIDKYGNPTSYYVGADIALTRFSDYIRSYVIKMALVFSGFFMLILGSCYWLSGYFLVYPLSSLEKHIDGLMEGIDDQARLDKSVENLKKLQIHTGDELEKLYQSICEMASGIAEQIHGNRILARSNEKMQRGLIITMADLVENRDSETDAHIEKTAAYVQIILNGLKRKGYYADRLTDKYIHDVVMSAPLHDIGKIQIPEAILDNHGKLSAEEFEIMKKHTTAGRKILEDSVITAEGENHLKEARNMAAYHHEHWDGTGYPEGLSGQVIPLSARVMALADVFDALVSKRVYKPPYSYEQARQILQDDAGKQFDPKCVEVFLEAQTEVRRVMRKYQDGEQ